MIVVSNTSPILNLAVIGQLDLLRQLYCEIVIALAVQIELARNGFANLENWIRAVELSNLRAVDELLSCLDPGESESIVLASELHSDLLLLDEKRGRRIAAERSLQVSGLLGVLAEAKLKNMIHSCGSILDQLMEQAGFWIAPGLRIRYFTDLGEGSQLPPF